MGCGASKNTEESTVVPTTLPAAPPTVAKVLETPAAAPVENTPVSPPEISEPPPQETPLVPEEKPEQVVLSVEVVEVSRIEQVTKDENIERNSGSALSRSIVPSIPVADAPLMRPTTAKPVAFEIPLDDDLFQPTAVAIAAAVAAGVVASSNASTPLAGDAIVAAPAESANSTKLSLPKLALSERDILAKLANTEERWKDLERAKQDAHHRKRRTKPSLTSQHVSAESGENPGTEVEDPLVLKNRLLEKEARAASRRARELLKLQTKLAKQEEHAKQVQERKKKLGKHSNEALNLSWGGEEEEGKKVSFGRELQDAVGIEGLMKMKSARKDELLDNDSGKGSSVDASRSGSGRSLGF
ncbi:hypothetical protein HDU98_007478 [Podochytrium sp. JEL0797]|nr:hypothetical protein HDU98_007478 [Podochytrium sp. JEL0797]